MVTQIRSIICFTAILTCAGQSVSDVFPTASTTNLEIQCQDGFSIGGGADATAWATAWATIAPCRLHCECVAKDGSCKYCCKNAGATCERHLPLYKYASGSCLTCAADQYLHEAGVSGSIGTSDVDATVQWVARGSNMQQDLVANAAGHRFLYYSGFVACWSNDGNGNSAQAATSCTDFPSTTTSTGQAAVGTDTDFVTPYMSAVLNQGGCGNCYIQAAMATVTDRALVKMTSTERDTWTSNSMSYSTGSSTRCHYTSGTGDACDGGDPAAIMKQLAGKSAGTNNPGYANGAGTCKGGVYGGPGTTTAFAEGSTDYYSSYAYGCVSGCTPFQAGFAGPALPAGATCPTGYTDDLTAMKAGFMTEPITSSNFNQFSTSCGCGGTMVLESVGACTYCGALKGDVLYAFGKWATIAAADCSWAHVSGMFNLAGMSESDFSAFAMTGEVASTWVTSASTLENALSSLGCPAATKTVTYDSSITECTACCIPRPYPTAGMQYLAETKAVQAPAQCSGAGVTAGSTPGASACSVGTCPSTCDSTSDVMPTTEVVFDDSAESTYTPIGMIYGDTNYDGWNAMNEHFIKDEIAQHGPVAVGFDVTANFQNFFGSSPTGILTVTDSETLRIHGGHAVSIVGWGSSAGQKYWLVRNSWSRSWADAGFFRVEIGGGVASRMFFTTNKFGVAANSAVLKTGSFRRLRAEEKLKKDQARRLATATKTSTTPSSQKHGGSVACTGDHATEVDALRVWFLKNASNYMGVSSACSAPWTYDSSSGCTAQIAKVLQITTTLHVKDCDGTSWHMTVKMSHDGVDISNSQVLSNSGPKAVQTDAVKAEATSDSLGVATTSVAWRSSASVGAALLLAARIMM